MGKNLTIKIILNIVRYLEHYALSLRELKMFKKYCVLAMGLMMTTAFAKPFAYVTCVESPNISVFDLANNTVVKTIPVEGKPHAIVIQGDKAYVTSNDEEGKVSVIELATNTMVQTLNVEEHPEKIFINANKAYITYRNSNIVSVIDLTTNTLLKTIQLKENPFSITFYDPDAVKKQ